MGRLEDIERRINERMTEIDRRLGGWPATSDPEPKYTWVEGNYTGSCQYCGASF